MKKLLMMALIIIGCCGYGHAKSDKSQLAAAKGVLERTIGRWPKNIEIALIESDKSGCDTYTIEVRRGVLRVEGSSGVAICKGFYDYLTSNKYGVVTWSGSRIELPAKFPDTPLRRVVSPFKNHLYMNVCTFGYTTPFWGWEQWQREIDYMALHGVDMPLAPIGGEAIFARVWRSMGLTDQQIGEYFTGPAHMPWMRMGNMSKLDGAPTGRWHDGQIALQHKIIDQMQSLGMTPVYQGFAGFVPAAMKIHYPNIDLTETKWSGFKNYMLSPLDSLFTQIGTQFITEWEREFGKGKYYLIDSFNEMDIPFGEKGSEERAEKLRTYGSTIYRSLSSASPDAVWVMQGWMFGYQRALWDPQSVEALLSGAPNGKMMILDLAVDFNNFIWRSERSWDYLDGFFGKEWIFSTVPNFGGRSAITGALEFYANGHLEALRSPNKGALTGYGTSPEGIETNDVVYDLISAAGWSDKEIDVKEFLHTYSAARYGSAPAQIDAFWSGMLQSAYGNFTNNARYRWQMRPSYQRMNTMGINEHYYEAIESFLECSAELSKSELYRADAVQYAALYLSSKADVLLNAINWAYVKGDTVLARKCEVRFEQLLLSADRLLASHPILRLDRWEDMARNAGCTPQEKELFVRESRRLISIWGENSLTDYSCKVWSGLIRDFYVPRLRNLFQARHDQKTFDFSKWDKKWFQQTDISSIEPYADPIAAAKMLVASCRDIRESIIPMPEKAIAFWTPFEFTRDDIRIGCTIDQSLMSKLKGIRITNVRGTDSVTIDKIAFVANTKTWASAEPNVSVSAQRSDVVIELLQQPITEPLAREVNVTIWLKGKRECNSYGAIELIY